MPFVKKEQRGLREVTSLITQLKDIQRTLPEIDRMVQSQDYPMEEEEILQLGDALDELLSQAGKLYSGIKDINVRYERGR